MLRNPENIPMFFVDAMLGNIARKLRLLGYDSKYFSDINDTKLIDIAIKDKRLMRFQIRLQRYLCAMFD